MTLLQYLKQTNKADLHGISKLVIRELESESSGHWVCFVDQEQHSYDVQMFINGNKIQSIQCDCQSASELCEHKFRMVMELEQVLKNKKSTVSKTTLKGARAPKLSKSEQILRDTQPDLVYQWLGELFKKDKELEKNFVLNFQTTKQVEYTPVEIVKIIDEVCKAVIGKKKTADAALVKRLVDMLELALKPVQTYLMMSINQPLSLEVAAEVFLQITYFKYRMDYSGKRFSSFNDKFLNTFLGYIYNLKDKNEVVNIIENIVKHIENNKDELHYEQVYLKMFIAFTRLSKMEYKSTIVPLIIRLLKDKEYWDYNEIDLQMFALETFIEYDVFKEHYELFRPIRYENQYNILLLNHLVPIDSDLAERYANDIISLNVRLEYNLPYIHILGDIYMSREDFKGLATLQMQTFDAGCDIEDYLFIKQELQGTPEFKSFRTKLLTRLRNSSFVQVSNSLLYFQILQDDRNYAKILQVLDDTVPHEVILEFAYDLMVFNESLFLKKILELGQYHNYRLDIHEELAEFVVENFPEDVIRQGLKKYKPGYASLNDLIECLLEQDLEY